MMEKVEQVQGQAFHLHFEPVHQAKAQHDSKVDALFQKVAAIEMQARWNDCAFEPKKPVQAGAAWFSFVKDSAFSKMKTNCCSMTIDVLLT